MWKRKKSHLQWPGGIGSHLSIAALTSVLACAQPASAQDPVPPAQVPAPPPQARSGLGGLSLDRTAQRTATERELEAFAIIDRKIMIPMRDGTRVAADIYRPKDTSKTYATVLLRSPYAFNYWDVANGTYNDMNRQLDTVKHGYAFVYLQERGKFFSEGYWDQLNPLSDGFDAIKWITTQPWSNGKLGTSGCSSGGDWQIDVAADNVPGLTTFVPAGFGSGIGHIGPYWEQGTWYRGGAFQMPWLPFSWDDNSQDQVRPMFPLGTSQAELVEVSKRYDLAPQMPSVDWSKALRHLPLMDVLHALGGGQSQFADPMPNLSGGKMIQRAPNDPAWSKMSLWNGDKPINISGLWFMSWYDISIGPNLAAYNRARELAKSDDAKQQYAVIWPSTHCAYNRPGAEDSIVGERHMGDTRFDSKTMEWAWFDHFLKGENNGVLEKNPKVRYYLMGANKWQSSETWPPPGVKPVTYYLDSGGKANTLNGDGVLGTSRPDSDRSDTFVYDPLNPVPTRGGQFCCLGNEVPGAMDQSRQEERPDILVYTSSPLAGGLNLTGSVNVELYVTSDAKDTDFTVKLIDVYPDGTAYNLDENIQRMRYRDGYDKPLVWMTPGEVAKATFQPIETANYFLPGHRIRIEISSSNFPPYDRNLNTGGNNYDESKPVVAHNGVRHGPQYPSSITLSVLP